jgi:hypothetical protein
MSEAQNVPNLSRILVAAVCRRARAEGYTTRRSAGPQTWTSTEYRRLTSPLIAPVKRYRTQRAIVAGRGSVLETILSVLTDV